MAILMAMEFLYLATSPKVQAIFWESMKKKPTNTKVSSLVLKSFKPNI